MKEQISSFDEYQKVYQESLNDPSKFWGDYARENFVWKKPWNKVYSADFEKAKFSWFEGAALNITENCLDRHLSERGDQTAIIWEPNEPGEQHKTFTYNELHAEVCRVANALKSIGVKKGDRVCLYLPMVPELAFAVLACARIGAVHSVVFAGFSSKSLSDRINDASCSVVLTADGGPRGEKVTPLKDIVDQALESCDCVDTVVVLNRANNDCAMTEGRDIWWHDFIDGQSSECPAEEMDSEDPLFILYTSGSTGKPKGMVHSSGGYMVYTTYSFQQVFQYKPGDIYWCTADIGWITGHSYIVYGPLSAGATTVMFEGTPAYPDMGRFWDVVDKYKVNIFYTAPTAIRALAQCDPAHLTRTTRESLRVLGTVGEPINQEAWDWYNTEIGGGDCPIVDTWWQTETGGILISPLAGVTPIKPTYATLPLPGIQPVLMDENGVEIPDMEAEGRLCMKQPWPSMARTIYGNHQRYINTYFSQFPGFYFTGDGSRRDSDGDYRITGRVDDIVIVSGHNLGTAEIEDAIDEHKAVAEAAVVGYPHEVKGNSICAFLTLEKHSENYPNLFTEVLDLVSETIGPIAKPERMYIVPGLPKTRSGKIMRRILRKLAAGETDNLGDISTLLNPEVVEAVKSEMGL